MTILVSPGKVTASGASTRRSARRLTWLAVIGVFLAVLFLALRHAASFLVVNAPQRADAILVLEGGAGDSRYWKAVELAKQGYAQHILVDADSQGKQWGVTEADLAATFIERVTPGMAEICPITADSTFEEAADVRPCLTRSEGLVRAHCDLELPYPPRPFDISQTSSPVPLVGRGRIRAVLLRRPLVAASPVGQNNTR